MSWLEYHTRSEEYTIQAEELEKQQDLEHAAELYCLAARELVNAINVLDPSKKRTLSITLVSAASLYCRAGEFTKAKQLSNHWLAKGVLPSFAVEELKEVLGAIPEKSIVSISSENSVDIDFTDFNTLIETLFELNPNISKPLIQDTIKDYFIAA